MEANVLLIRREKILFIKFFDVVISAFKVKQTHNQLIPRVCVPFVRVSLDALFFFGSLCPLLLLLLLIFSVYLMNGFK